MLVSADRFSRWSIAQARQRRGSVRRGRGQEEKRRSSAMSGEARWPAEVLRAGGGVGVEVGTAGHVWQSHIYIRMRADWPKQRV